MLLFSVLIFYSDPSEEISLEGSPENRLRQTKFSSKIQKARHELLNFPFGRENAGKYSGKPAAKPVKEYERKTFSESGSKLKLDPISLTPAVKLKSECCEKYLKGKRCGRCPCFDLSYGAASF